jgi:hypothetical protein
LLHVLDLALGCTDDAELRRLAADARVGERTLEEWARHVEAFRASKQLFESGILPGPPGPRRRALDGRPRGAPDALVRARAHGTSAPLRFFWEALAFMVGFVLSLLVT